MLDIYELGDDESTPDEPMEDRFLGVLSLEDFREMDCFLGRCKEEGLSFKYFEDCRFLSGQIRKMLVLANECRAKEKMRSSEVTYLRLIGILEKAASKNSGMMTFCD